MVDFYCFTDVKLTIFGKICNQIDHHFSTLTFADICQDSKASRSILRPADMRLRTVPTGIFAISAISA